MRSIFWHPRAFFIFLITVLLESCSYQLDTVFVVFNSLFFADFSPMLSGTFQQEEDIIHRQFLMNAMDEFVKIDDALLGSKMPNFLKCRVCIL